MRRFGVRSRLAGPLLRLELARANAVALTPPCGVSMVRGRENADPAMQDRLYKVAARQLTGRTPKPGATTRVVK